MRPRGIIARWAAAAGLVVTATVLLLPSPCRGADASALVQQAVERYSQGQFQGSIALLEQARQTAQAPELLGAIHLYLGVNHEVLGDDQRAQQSFTQALTHDPTLKLDPRRFRSSAVRLFLNTREALRGQLKIVDESGALRTALVDGVLLGPVPLQRELSVGAHMLAVKDAQGEVVLQEPIVIGVGALKEVTLPLRLGAPPDTVARPAAGQAITAAADDPATLPEPMPDLADRAPGGRLWTWVAGGAAVVSLGGALALGLAARADHQEWMDQTGQDRDRWEDLASSGQDKQLGANILLGVGGALAVAAVALYMLEPGWTRTARPGSDTGFSTSRTRVSVRGSAITIQF